MLEDSLQPRPNRTAERQSANAEGTEEREKHHVMSFWEDTCKIPNKEVKEVLVCTGLHIVLLQRVDKNTLFSQLQVHRLWQLYRISIFVPIQHAPLF